MQGPIRPTPPLSPMHPAGIAHQTPEEKFIHALMKVFRFQPDGELLIEAPALTVSCGAIFLTTRGSMIFTAGMNMNFHSMGPLSVNSNSTAIIQSTGSLSITGRVLTLNRGKYAIARKGDRVFTVGGGPRIDDGNQTILA